MTHEELWREIGVTRQTINAIEWDGTIRHSNSCSSSPSILTVRSKIASIETDDHPKITFGYGRVAPNQNDVVVL